MTAPARISEAAGGELEAIYFYFGEFDGIALIDSPSNIDAALSIFFRQPRADRLKPCERPYLSTSLEVTRLMLDSGGHAVPASDLAGPARGQKNTKWLTSYMCWQRHRCGIQTCAGLMPPECETRVLPPRQSA